VRLKAAGQGSNDAAAPRTAPASITSRSDTPGPPREYPPLESAALETVVYLAFIDQRRSSKSVRRNGWTDRQIAVAKDGFL